MFKPCVAVTMLASWIGWAVSSGASARQPASAPTVLEGKLAEHYGYGEKHRFVFKQGVFPDKKMAANTVGTELAVKRGI